MYLARALEHQRQLARKFSGYDNYNEVFVEEGFTRFVAPSLGI